MPIVGVRFSGQKEAIRDLERFRRKAVPFAVRNALNDMAFEARSIWQREIKQEFTLRNTYTTRSVLVTRASGLNIDRMQSVVGSFAPYMADQEEGATVKGKSGQKGIPGPSAAGLQPGSERTKLVRSAYRLGAIHVSHPMLKGDRKRRNAIVLNVARRKGQSIALLERPSGGKALFRIMGGKRKMSTRLLWDFSRSSVRVPAAPTLKRTLKALEPKIPHMMHAAVLEQLRRNRVFGY